MDLFNQNEKELDAKVVSYLLLFNMQSALCPLCGFPATETKPHY